MNSGCAAQSKPLYLTAGFRPVIQRAREQAARVTDDDMFPIPPSPCPTSPRPVRFADGDAWKRWLVTDQRSVADRPDVLTYATPPLTEAAAHQRCAGGEPVRVHQRHRQRLGGQADRRLSRRSAEPAGNGRLSN